MDVGIVLMHVTAICVEECGEDLIDFVAFVVNRLNMLCFRV
jgi:hypothetical protein